MGEGYIGARLWKGGAMVVEYRLSKGSRPGDRDLPPDLEGLTYQTHTIINRIHRIAPSRHPKIWSPRLAGDKNIGIPCKTPIFSA